jgi:DNA polymerase-3 subunit gamma/tau
LQGPIIGSEKDTAVSEVFYRKWRPRRLDQVVGQEGVTQTLRNAVALDRVAHAYLFCGPRGTGKTSTARIMAKAVNCLHPEDGEPDNECEICRSIDEARALDLIEIDAASNRGIDDIRNLREKVHFTPNVARYKVYIVDEVHMLTEPAFNALLKTLEEPPPHVIFVLATTEVHKVPLTVISRCQRFDFRRIPLETTVARLTQLCEDEGIEAPQEALRLIARSSGGSLRDAENLLEQALISYGSPLTEDQVSDLLELGSDEKALELVGHVVSGSVREGLTVINEVADEGTDLRQFHRGVMEYLRGVLLMKSGADSSLGYPEETKARLGSMAKDASLSRVVRALKSYAGADLRRDTSSPLPLELALLESSMEDDSEATAPRQPPAQAPVSRGTRPAAPVSSAPPPRGRPAESGGPGPVPSGTHLVAGPPERAGQPAKGPAAADSPGRSPDAEPSEPLTGLEAHWSDILRSLSRYKGKRFNLGALLRDCREREVADGTVTLRFSYRSHMERMQEELADPQTRKVLEDALAKALDGPHDIVVAAVGGRGNGPRQSASQRSHLVRAAQAMGARIVGEKEEEGHDE